MGFVQTLRPVKAVKNWLSEEYRDPKPLWEQPLRASSGGSRYTKPADRIGAVAARFRSVARRFDIAADESGGRIG
jgi:hypothetical protein